MLLLTSITDKLQIITGADVAVDVHASWVDNASGTVTPGRQNTLITTATTTDVVPVPGASTQRNIKTLLVRNKDATLNVDVTVQHTDGTTVAQPFKVTLQPGYALQFIDGIGFLVFTATGQALSGGLAGTNGAVGAQGIACALLFMDDNYPEPPLLVIPDGIMTRSKYALDAKNWAFLGTIAGTGVSVGPLVWAGQYQQIYFEYIIGGYSGGTPVGRILCGSAAISTTALSNGNALVEGVTLNATSVSVPGCPLGITGMLGGRQGRGFISGASGAFKQIDILGKSNTPAVATSPLIFQGASFFSDLGTNLLIQRLQLSVYDLVTGAVVSANTFTATTQLWAWGRNND